VRVIETPGPALRQARAAADTWLVTNFVRTLTPASLLSQRARILAGAVLATCMLACAFLAPPAGAVVTELGGTTVGLQPRTEVAAPGFFAEEVSAGHFVPRALPFANDSGNPVVHGSSVYVVYWDPTKGLFHKEWLTKIDEFMQRLGASSGELGDVAAAVAQYRDRTNQPAAYSTVYKGSYHDTAKYPTTGNCTDPNPLVIGAVTCLTDAQLRAQLQSFIASNHLPKGMNTIYYLLTPPGVTVCVGTHCSDYAVSEAEAEHLERNSASFKNSFCSYHADINPESAPLGNGNTILYAAIPWSAGFLGSFDHGPTYLYEHPFEPESDYVYSQAIDCQDGGFNPRTGEAEEPKPRNTSEEEAFAKADAKEKEELLHIEFLENGHIEEPNKEETEGKGELGDYAAGLADLIANQISQEQTNIVSDPLLNAWQSTTGHLEAADMCRNVFGNTVSVPGVPGLEGSVEADLKTEAGSMSNTGLGANAEVGPARYYLNNVYSLSNEECVGGAAMVPRFTSPNPVNAGEIVGFDGMASVVGLVEGRAFGPTGPPTTTYATYSWNFGDGTTPVTGYALGSPLCEEPWLSPCAASLFHSYQYGGKYDVTLTVTDVAGNVDSVSHEVIVNGPAVPTAAAPGTSAPGSSSAPTKTGNAPTSAPKPVATATVLSHSLQKVLNKGLVVGYSVNEQVAGHFNVMLSRSVARKLHIKGTPANGLPAGTAPQLVIARSVLVTTKGGHNTVSIHLSKKIAAQLRKASKVSLLLQLIVRNAASANPASSSVLTAVKLSR
jgi:PKD domain